MVSCAAFARTASLRSRIVAASKATTTAASPSPLPNTALPHSCRVSSRRHNLSSSSSSSSVGGPFFSTPHRSMPMKPGTPIAGLEGLGPKEDGGAKGGAGSNPTAKPRNEYPAWVSELVQPPPALAKLRRMEFDDSTDLDKRRYLKLTRRGRIKEKNAEASG